jgi:hypothetical protein
MRNKAGQFFALYLVLLTLFMCGLAITIYKMQDGNVQNSLVSPIKLLEVEDGKDIFEMRESALIRSAADDVGWSNSDSIKKKFFELLDLEGGEGEKVREFIFRDFVYGDKEKGVWADALKKKDSQINFLKNENIYDFSLSGGLLEVNRKELGKRFRLDAVNRGKINFVAYIGYVYEGSYKIDRFSPVRKSIPKSTPGKVAIPKSDVGRKLIFIPINWKTGEVEFLKKTKVSFDYAAGLKKLKGSGDGYSAEYKFNNLDIDNFDDLDVAVEMIEAHVKSLGGDYDSSEDIIIAFSGESFGEGEGFVHTPYNQVVFTNEEPGILAHELGHSVFGYCEEYAYFEIECPDSVDHKDLVSDIIQENIELVTDFFWDLGEDLAEEEELELIDVFYQNLQISQEYIDKYPDTDDGEYEMGQNLLDATIDCETNGWLRQNFNSKYLFRNSYGVHPRMFDGCQNSYPTCCVDSPNYAGDGNKYGANCFSGALNKADAPELCIGSFCGDSCRSIMGANLPLKDLEDLGITRRYPI